MLHSYNKNYSLEIVSHHPEHTGRVLRKYAVDGIDTVGAWNGEPFEIRFKNHSWQKVQVKISVDGTDILTGDLANTQVSKDMWVVQPYGTLSLKAWPETNKGGAAFIFTSADNGVGTHLHGDQSNRGVIAAAVYVEGHKEPERFTKSLRRSRISAQSLNFNDTTKGTTIGGSSAGGIYSVDSISDNFDCERSLDDSLTLGDLKELVAVGAGEQVSQNISYVQGLTKPVFSEIVKVKYLWWDDLVSKLKGASDTHQTGFPGDRRIMSLGNTPRLKTPGKKPPVKRPAPFFSKF